MKLGSTEGGSEASWPGTRQVSVGGQAGRAAEHATWLGTGDSGGLRRARLQEAGGGRLRAEASGRRGLGNLRSLRKSGHRAGYLHYRGARQVQIQVLALHTAVLRPWASYLMSSVPQLPHQ